jgi:N utilization substance protein B
MMSEHSDGAPSHRHRAREIALQALYALDLQGRRAASDAARLEEEGDLEAAAKVPVACAEEVFAGMSENFEMPAAVRAFARELVLNVSACRDELDETLSSQSRNWRVSRMAAVDRNILRLATFELTRTDTPAAVILDEAVELARHFGSDPSPAFVNGVLDAVKRKVRGEAVS